MNQKPSLQAWTLLLTLSLIWGSSFVLIKRGLVGLTPDQVGALRMASAMVFLLPVSLWHIRKIKKDKWVLILSAGLLGSLIPAFLFAVAQTRLDSGITGVLNTMVPIFTVIIGWVVYRRQQPATVIVGVVLGFGGSAILIIAGQSSSLAVNTYALLVIVATLCYAGNLNLVKYHLSHLRALTVTSTSLLLAGPLALIYLLAFTDFISRVSTSVAAQTATGYVVLLGVLSTAIALILFNRLVQITEPVFTSSVTYIIPIVAVAWAVYDGEQLFVQHYIGMATILLGVYVTNRIRR